MQLGDVGGQRAGEARDLRALVFRHSHHDLLRLELEIACLHDVAATALEEPLDAYARAHGQAEMPSVGFQIARHLVLGRKVVAGSGKGHPVQAIELRGREQPQRVPAFAPCRSHPLLSVQNHKPSAGASEVISHRQPRLPSSDDDDVKNLPRRQLDGRGPFFDQSCGSARCHESLLPLQVNVRRVRD